MQDSNIISRVRLFFDTTRGRQIAMWLAYFVYWAGIAAYLPYIGIYYESIGLKGGQIGQLSSIPHFVTLLSSFLISFISDRTRRHKSVLAVTAIGIILVLFIYPSAKSFAALVPIVLAYAILFAPSSAIRWEIDLSGGGTSVPFSGPLGINVNPLSISGGISEQVNSLLGDRQPFAHAELFARGVGDLLAVVQDAHQSNLTNPVDHHRGSLDLSRTDVVSALQRRDRTLETVRGVSVQRHQRLALSHRVPGLGVHHDACRGLDLFAGPGTPSAESPRSHTHGKSVQARKRAIARRVDCMRLLGLWELGIRVAVLAGGAAGKRMALPNAKILIHQVSSGFQGQATDIEIHAKEIIDVRQRLDHILAKHTGQDYEKVRGDTERDYFMSSEEAKEYGLIDRVISEH